MLCEICAEMRTEIESEGAGSHESYENCQVGTERAWEKTKGTAEALETS